MSEISIETHPRLPAEFHRDWGAAHPHLHDAYRASRAWNLEAVHASTEPIMPAPDGGIPYVEVAAPPAIAPDEIDASSAVIMPHSFGSGWGGGSAHVVVRARILRTVAPHERLITFPNSSPGQPIYDFNRQEQRQIASGDFTPMSDRVFRTLDALGIKKIRAAGYSQGAATSGHILARAASEGYFAVDSSGFFDMPNIVQRTTGRLAADFLATGSGDVSRARVRSGINVLTEGKYSTAHALKSLAGKICQSDNAAFARGLRHNTFQGDMQKLLTAAQDIGVLLIRAEHSTVTPRQPFEEAASALQRSFPDRVQYATVVDCGHGICEHPVMNALLAQKAFQAPAPVTNKG